MGGPGSRQQRFRQRQRALGLSQVNVVVPGAAIPELQELARADMAAVPNPEISTATPALLVTPAAVRQRRYRAHQRKAGFVPVTLLVPASAAAELQLLAEALRRRPHLLPGPLRDSVSCRLVSAKAVLREGQ